MNILSSLIQASIWGGSSSASVSPSSLFEISDWANNTDRPNFKVGMHGGKHDVMPPRPQRRRYFGNWRTVADTVRSGTGGAADVTVQTPLYGAVGGTEMQLTIATGNTLTVAFDASQVKAAGSEIDVSNSSIGFSFRGISNTNLYTGLFQIDLFDSGTPASPATYYLSGGSGSEFANWSTNSGTTEGREQRLSVDISQFTQSGTGGTTDKTKIKWARIRIGASGGTIVIAPKSIDATPRVSTKGRVCFSFDDGGYTQYSFLAPLFQRYGMRATAYLSPLATILGTTNTSTYQTTQQVINLLESFGWQIGSQGFSTEAAAILGWTNDQLTAEGNKLRAMHAALGVWGGIDGSYFGGVNHANVGVYDPLFRRHYRTMRGFRNGRAFAAGSMTPIGETLPFGDPSLIRAYNFSSGYTTGQAATMWIGLVDQAIATKGAACFAGHSEFGSTGATLYADLVNLLTYCEQQVAAGNLECNTVGELVALINTYA
ncbi:hypothetical protein ACIPLR_12270 [Herbaspirillum huttiense]|uniref:hypothetical protein n=1 Tax=Herbaspirillum huttiense TaxID=863372 RepID=UPI0037F3366F